MRILSRLHAGKPRSRPKALAPAVAVALQRLTWLSVAAVFSLAFLQVASAQEVVAGGGCGAIEKSDNGPYDYRLVRDNRLHVVEQNHFLPKVESLVSGNTGSLGADIDFTLRAFPNHHRALLSMMRLSERLKTPKPVGANYSVECYFDRALRFQPTDNTARMIYATYLTKMGRTADVLKQLDIVGKTAEDNPFTHYNMGLIYFDVKEYDRALAEAHIAYSLGFVRTELKDQLVSVGKWKEPDPAAQPPEGTASQPAATDAAKEPAKETAK
jgi:hypothetical protein